MMRCCENELPTGFSCPVAEGDPLQGCRKITEHCAGEGELGMSPPGGCKQADK